MSAAPCPGRFPLLVVTGMSGAGRSTALKALEDMGYEAVDNLPLSLLPSLVGPQASRAALAVGVDVRTRDFAALALIDTIDGLIAERGVDLKMVFLDCDDELLERRYTETRRRHPLAAERPVADGIRLERQRVWPLRGRADLVIDSSALTAADLKRLLHGHFALDAAPGIAIFVTSFAYRHGLPRDADLVFDVRFLRNPHYDVALRSATGRDAAVGAYIAADPDFHRLFDALCRWLDELLPRYEREGKSYLTIAFGCTGGRHRSVFCAERLAAWLRGKGRRVVLAHRDLDRSAEPVATAGVAALPAQSLKDIA
jgi:RNase adapter protein RapZ